MFTQHLGEAAFLAKGFSQRISRKGTERHEKNFSQRRKDAKARSDTKKNLAKTQSFKNQSFEPFPFGIFQRNNPLRLCVFARNFFCVAPCLCAFARNPLSLAPLRLCVFARNPLSLAPLREILPEKCSTNFSGILTILVILKDFCLQH